MKQKQAFNGSKEVKNKFLVIAKEHQKQDRFIQGDWLRELSGEYKKGCFFGCMTQTANNTLQEASNLMDIPLWLVHVTEKIFEGLEQKDSLKFPLRMLKAIPIDMDSEKVWKKWSYTLLMHRTKGQIRFIKKGSEQYKAIKQCAGLFLMDDITESAARSATMSAMSAARSAESADWSARSAVIAARSAAMSAMSADWSADWSARSAVIAARSAMSVESSAESADWIARSDYYKWMMNTLINICKKN